jgi:hypothetical protein
MINILRQPSKASVLTVGSMEMAGCQKGLSTDSMLIVAFGGKVFERGKES